MGIIFAMPKITSSASVIASAAAANTPAAARTALVTGWSSAFKSATLSSDPESRAGSSSAVKSAGWAGVTQLAECLLPKQNVAGSNPVSRSNLPIVDSGTSLHQ